MPIPSGVETVTVTSGEPLTLPDGTLYRGHIRFVAPDLAVVPSDDFTLGGEAVAELVDGEFSITLVAPDATSINPTDWTYTVIGEFVNAPDWTTFAPLTKDQPNVVLSDVIESQGIDPAFSTIYLRRDGGTMTGDLVLAGDPNAALEASTKQYTDAQAAAAQAAAAAESVSLTGAETVAGVKTFTSIPVLPASNPTTANQAARKQYIDDLDVANVKLTGDQTVTGVKAFGSIPVGPASDPTTSNQLTRKTYVDNLDAANVKLTGDQTVAGVKTFSSIPVLPASDPSTANQATRKTYVDAKIISEILGHMGLDTGVLSGGEVNVNVDPSKVDISSTVGIIVDYVTTPSTPAITKVTFAGSTVTISNLAAPVTWLMLDDDGNVVQQTTRPTNAQRRTHIQLGAVLVSGGSIIADQTLPSILPHTLNQLYDLMDAIGAFNVSGNILSAASTNLTLAKTAGTVFVRGFNHFADDVLTNDPHISETAAQNPVSMRYATQLSAAPAAPVTNVDVANYDVGGVITAIPGGANTSTIQRVFVIPLNDVASQIAIQYGQTTYASLDAAIAAVASENPVLNPNLGDAVLIGYLVTKKSTTNLSDTTQARIVKAAKISGNAAGISDSLSLAVLLSGAQTVTGLKTFTDGIAVTAGVGTILYADKDALLGRNTTIVPAADPDLTVTLEANSTYVVECVAVWASGGGGFRCAWSAPAGASMTWTDNDGVGAVAPGTNVTFASGTGTTFQGRVKTAGTAGALTFLWAQNTSNAADTNLREGSYLLVRRVE